MQVAPRILHLEDDPLDTRRVQYLLRDDGLEARIDRVHSETAFRDALQSKDYALVLSDYTVAGVNVRRVLQASRQLRPEVPFVFFSGTIGEDVGVEMMKLGASDFVLKQREARLAPAVRRALQDREEQLRRKAAEQQRRISEDRYRSLVQAGAQAVWVATAQGEITEDSPSWRGITGQSYEQFRGYGWVDALHPDDRRRAGEVWRQAVVKRGPYDIEYRVRNSAGEYRHMHARAVPVLNEDGSIREWVGMNTDVTDRKLAEDALRHSEERYRLAAEELQAVMDAAPAGICVAHDPRCCLITGNRVAHELFGVPIDQNLSATPAGDDTPPYYRIYRNGQEVEGPNMPVQIAAATGATVRDVELEAVRRDGTRRTFLLTAAPLRSADGSIRGAVGAFTDITERKRAEEALSRSEAKLRAFVESSIIGILNGDLDGNIYDCNEELARIVGRPRQDVLDGKVRWTEITPPEDLPLDAKAALEATATGRCTPYEKHYIRPDGTRVPIVVGYVLLEPERHRSVAFILDITQRKRMEMELKAARDFAEQAKVAAEEASKAKDHFLAVLSHELRNPLTPVLTTATLLQEDPSLPADLREQLEVIRRNAELEARLIDDLLDVTRITRGKMELHAERIELCRVISRAVEVCQPDLDAREIHFGIDWGMRPYWVNADVGRLQQVFWNLLKNAIKFTPRGGCIGIRCRPANGYVMAEVADSGIGIEPEMLPLIFNAFQQAERSITRQFGGLGLGLTISKALVDLHGGRIEAQSEGKGKGSIFRVHLPVAAGVAGPAPTLPEPPAARRQQAVKSLSILLVEDHGDTARIMQRLLASDGHRVTRAADMATAIEIAQKEPFDLLLSDLGLPDGSGLDLLRQLRRQGFTDLRAIALSGYGQEQDIQRSRDAGFSTHLTKPASPDQLRETIARVTA